MSDDPIVKMDSQQGLAPPVALEWTLSSQPGAVRAIHWPGGRTAVVLIHDIEEGSDLDSWAELPDILNQEGYTVIALDLPGHGLSAGEFSESAGREAVDRACQHAKSITGNSPAIIAAGDGLRMISENALTFDSIRALVVLSPSDAPAPTGTFPKLAFVGATDERSRAAADLFLRTSQGWTLVSSFGTAAQGHQLLETPHAPKLVNQLCSFLREYRVPTVEIIP